MVVFDDGHISFSAFRVSVTRRSGVKCCCGKLTDFDYCNIPTVLSSREKAADPLIDLALFHSRTFVVVNIVAALASGF